MEYLRRMKNILLEFIGCVPLQKYSIIWKCYKDAVEQYTKLNHEYRELLIKYNALTCAHRNSDEQDGTLY
jgi:hypothetical protein